jgi:hypothetical protein
MQAAWHRKINRRPGPRAGVPFLLFPQADGTFPEPERILIAPFGGPIRTGPADDGMRVVDALGKSPYAPPDVLPPWRGPVAPPVRPGPNGGFDHLAVDTRQFAQAHLFGCTRLTLNVWETYVGKPVRWSLSDLFPVLELVPLVDWPNAQSGPGFLETGMVANDAGELRLYCLNLDVIAHEVGHTVLFAELGTPAPGRLTAQYLAFHECFADLTTILAALQFGSVIDRVLGESGGNLYAENEINRIAELSSHEQIRMADTKATMADVAGIELAEDGSWRDPSGLNRNAHALAEPLTGALFDFFVELFQEQLVAEGLVPADEDPRGWTREEIAASLDRLRSVHRHALERSTPAFREALVSARDGLGLVLAQAIALLPADGLSFDAVAGALVMAGLGLFGPRTARTLEEVLLWRGIVPRAPLPVRRPARRYTALAPLAVQARCCRPGPGRAHAAMQLGAVLRQGHRAPGGA